MFEALPGIGRRHGVETSAIAHAGDGNLHPSLAHTPSNSTAMAASHHSRTSEPSYSSQRGLPLPRLLRLRVIPFLGLPVVHRYGALGAAWSTWSTNDIHWSWTVCAK